jgi:hypothetical protein
MRDRRGAYTVLVGKPEGNRALETHKDVRITLKCIFKKWDGKASTGLIWRPRIGRGGGLF